MQIVRAYDLCLLAMLTWRSYGVEILSFRLSIYHASIMAILSHLPHIQVRPTSSDGHQLLKK